MDHLYFDHEQDDMSREVGLRLSAIVEDGTVEEPAGIGLGRGGRQVRRCGFCKEPGHTVARGRRLPGAGHWGQHFTSAAAMGHQWCGKNHLFSFILSLV